MKITTAEQYFAALAHMEELTAEDPETMAKREELANMLEDFERAHPEVVYPADVEG